MNVPNGKAKTPDAPPPQMAVVSAVRKRSWAWRTLVLSIFVVALGLGLLYQQRIVGKVTSLIHAAPQPHGNVLYWMSPHDPTFKSDHPGKDSMGMDLVPVYEGGSLERGHVVIDPVLQEDEVTTGFVEQGPLVRTVHSIGTVAYAEPRVGDVTLKVNAWIEKLYVDYLGQSVRKGEPLFAIYSPELVATEQEFLIMLGTTAGTEAQGSSNVRRADERNVESVRERLRYWDLTDQQIDELAKTRRVPKTTTFYSPFDGIVTEKMAFEGKYMTAGSMLYRIADLSKVWIYLYVYQNQIHCVFDGQGATMTLPNLPGHVFRGKVVYIYPYLEPKIRAVKVRLEFENPDLVLKPGMFAQVVFEPHHMGVGLKVPQRAVLDTGTRQLVYLALPDDKFSPREVTTGMELDENKINILSGLTAGQRIVISPEFLLDSESRLRLINRKFKEPAAMRVDMEHPSHDKHGVSMPEGAMPKDSMPSSADIHKHQSDREMPAGQMPDKGPPRGEGVSSDVRHNLVDYAATSGHHCLGLARRGRRDRVSTVVRTQVADDRGVMVRRWAQPVNDRDEWHGRHAAIGRRQIEPA
jgi:RND family efflux transporter MFP subunit